jgi:hypothetical protein
VICGWGAGVPLNDGRDDADDADGGDDDAVRSSNWEGEDKRRSCRDMVFVSRSVTLSHSRSTYRTPSSRARTPRKPRTQTYRLRSPHRKSYSSKPNTPPNRRTTRLATTISKVLQSTYCCRVHSTHDQVLHISRPDSSRAVGSTRPTCHVTAWYPPSRRFPASSTLEREKQNFPDTPTCIMHLHHQVRPRSSMCLRFSREIQKTPQESRVVRARA